METVLITGASRGIGLELTKQFLQLNYKVIATYRGEPTSELASLCANNPLTLFELEVTDETSINQLVTSLGNTQIDILINNAGVIGPEQQTMTTIKQADWLTTFAINSIAPLMVSRALLGNMKVNHNPRIVTISSEMGSISRDSVGMYAYRSSKAAVNKVMKVLAMELQEQGISVIVLHPGWVQTDMGGQQADITTQESVNGIINVAKSLTLTETGQFLTWQGNELAW